VLAAGAAIVMVVLVLSRRQEAAEVAADPETPATVFSDDPFAAMGSNVAAQPIPNGGFDFGGGYVPQGGDLFGPLTIDDPPPPTTVIVQLQPLPAPTVASPAPTPPVATVDPGGVTGTGAGSPGGGTVSPGTGRPAGTVADKKPRGYYRSRKGGVVTFINPAGAASRATLTATQKAGILAFEKKAAAAPVRFALDGTYHIMERSLAFHPAAYTGG